MQQHLLPTKYSMWQRRCCLHMQQNPVSPCNPQLCQQHKHSQSPVTDCSPWHSIQEATHRLPYAAGCSSNMRAILSTPATVTGEIKPRPTGPRWPYVHTNIRSIPEVHAGQPPHLYKIPIMNVLLESIYSQVCCLAPVSPMPWLFVTAACTRGCC